MKATEEQRQFIINTLLPYKENPSTCGYDDKLNQCKYLTHDGKMCAVGKWLDIDEDNRDEAMNYNDNVEDLVRENRFQFKPEALAMNLPIQVWGAMQTYHDDIAELNGIRVGISKFREKVNLRLGILEMRTGVNLPELRF